MTQIALPVRPQQTGSPGKDCGAGAGLQAGKQMLGIMRQSVPHLCYNGATGKMMTTQLLEPQPSNLGCAEKTEPVL
jgi:hypothetical protein